jgi:membrane-associated phospholipid phosphatase
VFLSVDPHPFASRSLALAGWAALLGCAVLTWGRPVRAEQPTTALASDASAGANEPVAASAPPAEGAPVAPSLPGRVPTLVSVDAPPPLVWKWAHFSLADYFVTGAGAATTLAMAIVHPRAQHSLTSGLSFDESVRNALRADTLANRYIFRDASDVGVSLMVSWPFVADALTTAWWYRGSREAAQEMALIDLEALAVAGAVQGVTNVMVSRERPYGRDCGSSELPSDSIDCTSSGRYRSFFSGHTSLSFTGAALICVHHFKNELIGAPWDALSCAGGYAVATATGTFRMMGDMHYATDVLTGALMGTLVGYGVPLLHYSRRGSTASPLAGVELHLIPSPGGVGLLGVF